MMNRDDADFLPNFFAPATLLSVLLMGAALALVLAVVGEGPFWEAFGRLALFVEWVVLVSVTLLGLGRRWLARMPAVAAGAIAWGVAVAVTGACAHAASLALYGGSVGEPVVGFVLRAVAVGAVVSALALRHLYVRQQWRRQLRAEARARLQAFQARIRPHFLFNSLNTVAALTRSDPARAERAVEDLADIFRATLGGPRGMVALEEELELVRRHLDIEALRLGERLRLEWEVEPKAEEAALPPLILQPLVENAVYHGIEPRPEGGTVRIAAHLRGDRLELEVTNPRNEPASRRGGNRMALENIRERLKVLYGRRAELAAEEGDGIYRVRMVIPQESEGERL